MDLSIYTIIILITALFIISLDVVILIGSKNLSSRCFALLSFLTGVWVFSQGLFISSTDAEWGNLFIKGQHLLGIIIAIGFYHFSIIYPHDKKPSNKLIILSLIIILIFDYLYFFTDKLIVNTYQIGGVGRWAWSLGKFHLLFDLSFYVLWTIALFNLYRTYTNEIGELRVNLKNMFFALLLGIIPPTVMNILLPSFGEYRLNWIGPITSFIWIYIVAYSIIKYRQMNVKAVITEILAISVTVMSFINIFMNISTNIFLRILTFVIFIVLAFYLIRSTLRESRQKEQLRDLSLHLADKVAEQTHEVKKAYEIEKKARRDLEKLNETKDQFVMITQHNLRTPVTTIRWEIESLLSGAHGELTTDMRKTLQDTSTSVHTLMRIVDDFLNITALKAGSQILNFSQTTLKPILESIIQELRLEIREMNLTIEYPQEAEEWPELEVDSSKIREVMLIIIENAVRYNIKDGSIKIQNEIKGQGDLFEMVIGNTGVGIAPEETRNIFERLFYRSKRAKSKNPSGMGIGLSVARAITRAHHGEILITSEGENRGATVTLTLPLRRPRFNQE